MSVDVLDEGPGHPTEAPRRPSSAAIRSELVTLRQEEGVTIPKIREFSPNLMALPASRDELERWGYSPDDGHVAAYQVLECGVQHLALQTEFSRILQFTLNLNKVSGHLDERRTTVKGELNISPKQYNRLEKLAYEHFAGLLVACNQSPCPSGEAAEPLIQSKHGERIILDCSIDRSELSGLLRLVILEQRPTPNAEILTRIAENLPNGRNAANEYRPDVTGAEKIGWLLVQSVLTSEYRRRPLVEAMRDHLQKRQQDHPRPLRALMKRFLPTDSPKVGDPGYEELASRFTLSAEALGELFVHRDYMTLADRHPEAFLFPDGKPVGPISYFWIMLNESIDELAICITSIEERDTWADIIRGNNVTANT